MTRSGADEYGSATASLDLQLQNLSLQDALMAYRRELVRFETEKLAYEKAKEKEMEVVRRPFFLCSLAFTELTVFSFTGGIRGKGSSGGGGGGGGGRRWQGE